MLEAEPLHNTGDLKAISCTVLKRQRVPHLGTGTYPDLNCSLSVVGNIRIKLAAIHPFCLTELVFITGTLIPRKAEGWCFEVLLCLVLH